MFYHRARLEQIAKIRFNYCLMQLLIADQSFQVEEATLFGFVINPKYAFASDNGFVKSGLFWRLEIDAEDLSFWHEDIQFPHLRHWTDLVGQEVNWDSPYNKNTGEWDGGWYSAGIFGGNCEILQSKLRFIERSGCEFHIKWEGIASSAPLGCEADANERLHFEIDCRCVFIGVGVLNAGDSKEFEKREVIARHLDMGGFSEHFADTSKFVPGYMPMLKPHY